MNPGKLQYACQITAPANGVQPITFIFDDYKTLEASLKEAEKELNPRKVEVAFHENRINSYKNKIEQHEERVAKLNDPDYKEVVDIPMEQVEVEAVETEEV